MWVDNVTKKKRLQTLLPVLVQGDALGLIE
jgi:hypothetical protein